jgi:large subunit ribosomal protein L25
MQSYSLKVSKRPSTKIARRQRTNREIFGVVYGSGIEPIPVVGVSSEVNKTLIAAGTSRIIKLSIDDETKIDVLLKDSSNNPVTNELRHFDLLAVKKGEKINVEIPIILVGESPATKLGHVIHQLMDSVEVKTEPSDIPESIEVDISTLIEVGDSIMLNQVKIDDRLKLMKICLIKLL